MTSVQAALSALQHTYLDLGLNVGLYTLANMQAGVEIASDVFHRQTAAFGYIGGGAALSLGANATVYAGLGINVPPAGGAYKTGVVNAWDGPVGSISIPVTPVINLGSISPWSSLPLGRPVFGEVFGINAGISTPSVVSVPAWVPASLALGLGVGVAKYMHWNALTEAEFSVLASVLGMGNLSLVRDPSGFYIQFGGTPVQAALNQSIHQLSHGGAQAIPGALLGILVALTQEVPGYLNACSVTTTPMPKDTTFFSDTFNNQKGYYGYFPAPTFVVQREPGTENTFATYEFEYGNGSIVKTGKTTCVPPGSLPGVNDCSFVDATNKDLLTQSGGSGFWRVRRAAAPDGSQPAGPWSFKQTFTPPLGTTPGIYGPAQGASINFAKLTNLNVMVPVAWINQYATLQPYLKFTKANGGFTLFTLTWPSATTLANHSGVTADGQFYNYLKGRPGDIIAPAGTVTAQFGLAPLACKTDITKCTPSPGTPTLAGTYNQL